jgi:glyoxylase-like metal-dependent hydrolase (beta-lactamase superfamily II)
MLGGAAGLCCARSFGSVTGVYDASQPLIVHRVSPGLAVIEGAGGNVVAARGSGGLALVDGGLETRSEELLRLVLQEMVAPRVDVLFNTHWHPERVGSNRELGRAGARIIAHENTRLWLSTEITRPWDEHPFMPLPADAQPNETFYTKGEFAFGSGPIQYGYMLQSHTDGDM